MLQMDYIPLIYLDHVGVRRPCAQRFLEKKKRDCAIDGCFFSYYLTDLYGEYRSDSIVKRLKTLPMRALSDAARQRGCAMAR